METMTALSELSAEICYNYCVGENAEFFGLQYSTEGL
ncbi:expressed unknown protein [Ectocarpus siliculosus]|uniref:Uncharacterized protein n=1 Tax=Ectocarpus siliculosus TaxID=2880 RepID=D7G5F8_ECTSI|nr:hypothetical protein Esi_0075_0119 [Ectocarpus siliculosus]CBJ33852.1 expressed unknown protein [Ectocarpus siliculosus]|eukprot:CBJ27595.1 hypothetical protein Esi_0075_0119 [Ectocarpus siliculosus]